MPIYKKLIFITVLAVAVVGYFVFTRESPQVTQPMVEKPTAMTAPTRYVEYQTDTLDQVSANRRVLFFYANWCSTCRPADANFRENESQIPQDVILFRVNYNDPDTDADERTLAQRHQITYQHTFVQIDSQGNPVTRWNGGALDELLNNLKP